MFDGKAITITLPSRVTMEIIATEPVVKGQTASSSYKPATVESGARVMVPPHIEVGTRIVINTEDSSYVERAKD
jgi:elongation factor P